jgi:pimeloyl-ACP methyl ester carboxylesterase
VSTPVDAARPTIFFLHALGMSAREFDGVAARLDDVADVVALDLPGFGEASAASGVSVDDMAALVVRKVRRHAPGRWLLVGHSMGGKIASVAASRALAGEHGLFGLSGVVLLAASPPTPEPMSDDDRAEKRAMADGGALDPASARSFVDANVGAALDPAADAIAVGDVQRASAEAWTAWFDRGSREDWSEAVGVLDVPALIVAGGSDGDLGESAQRELNGRVYPRAQLCVLEGAGHLLPLERPAEVADAIRTFWRDEAGTGPVVPVDVVRTLASSRVSTQTRALHARRVLADDPRYVPVVLDEVQLQTLRALSDRIVPQRAPEPRQAIDLAARVDARVGSGRGDGWRNAALPPDPEAYRRGLDELAGFGELPRAQQDALVTAIISGGHEPRSADFTAEQMTLWFEDCRVDLVRTWLSHPATMSRIGYDGYANGGDGPRFQGFQLLAADAREAWEPTMEAAPTEAAR